MTLISIIYYPRSAKKCQKTSKIVQKSFIFWQNPGSKILPLWVLQKMKWEWNYHFDSFRTLEKICVIIELVKNSWVYVDLEEKTDLLTSHVSFVWSRENSLMGFVVFDVWMLKWWNSDDGDWFSIELKFMCTSFIFRLPSVEHSGILTAPCDKNRNLYPKKCLS